MSKKAGGIPYKDELNFENLNIMWLTGEGQWGIPEIEPLYEYEDTEFMGFNYALGDKDPKNKGLHFFLDDYQFKRVWNDPRRYLPIIQRYKYVIAPDFTIACTMPPAVNLWHHYQKHWCASLWQYFGVKVIPSIRWSDSSSFDWCLDGEPRNAVIAVSATGMGNDRREQENFKAGFKEAMTELKPKRVLYFGSTKLLDEIPDYVTPIKSEQLKRMEVLRMKDGEKNGRDKIA